jgi:hypothetical protein
VLRVAAHELDDDDDDAVVMRPEGIESIAAMAGRRVPIRDGNKLVAEVKLEVYLGIVAAVNKYKKLHSAIMGKQSPMPLAPPKESKTFNFDWTITDFLEVRLALNDIDNMSGMPGVCVVVVLIEAWEHT